MNKEEVAKRLKIWGVDKFGKLNILAKNLNMLPQSLQKYTSGDALPGAEIISKLSALGCDIEWLLLRKDNPTDSTGKETQNENVSDANYKESISRKDKIILSQAEELTMLKVKIEELRQKVLELEEEQFKFIKKAGEQIKRESNKSSGKKKVLK